MSTRSDDVRLRPATPEDAQALLALKRQLDMETSFMLLNPSERTEQAREIADELRRMVRAGNSIVILAEAGNDLVGYVEAQGGRFQRNRFTAEVVIGVLDRAAGRGVGGRLLKGLEAWAAEHGLHRLELTVMAHNERALRLYGRMGFVVEGTRRECLSVDGQLVDELLMAKLLPLQEG
jgi:RimJ/RimL family protein N-acetyltransferase